MMNKSKACWRGGSCLNRWSVWSVRAILSDLGLTLWRLLPANPIVVRVVETSSKRLQHLWMRVGYLLILFFVMLVAQLADSGRGDSLAELAKSSSRVFEMISILQLAMMCLLAPVFAAGAISQEKDAETFNVLLTTPLSNAQIVLGSLASRLFFVIALLVAGLPIFCITMLFGGVTTGQIFLSFGIAACTAIVTGSLAILVSVLRVGTRGTIFSFYVGIAMYLVIGFAIGMSRWTIIPESIVPGTSAGMTWLALIHPFYALLVALNQIHAPDAAAVAGYGWPLGRMLASPHITYMWLTLLASAVMVSLATVFVRSGVKQGEQSLWARFLIRLHLRKAPGGNGERERYRRPRWVWANPVAWREAVTRANAASSNWMRYSYLVCAMAAGIVFAIAYGSGTFPSVRMARDWLIWLVMIEFVMVLLMAANTSATAITRERDDGTMELLLSTPLTSRYIIWGKLRGLVSFAVPLMAVPAVTVLIVSLLDLFRGATTPIVSLTGGLVLPFLLAVYVAFVCMVGLQMSLKSRRSVQAVLAAMGVLVVIAFGLGLCAFGAASANAEVGAIMAPLTFVTSVVFVIDPDQFAAMAGRAGGGTTAGDIKFLMVIGTLIAVMLYGGIVAGTYRSMVANFDMIVRKQSR